MRFLEAGPCCRGLVERISLGLRQEKKGTNRKSRRCTSKQRRKCRNTGRRNGLCKTNVCRNESWSTHAYNDLS